MVKIGYRDRRKFFPHKCFICTSVTYGFDSSTARRYETFLVREVSILWDIRFKRLHYTFTAARYFFCHLSYIFSTIHQKTKVYFQLTLPNSRICPPPHIRKPSITSFQLIFSSPIFFIFDVNLFDTFVKISWSHHPNFCNYGRFIVKI